MEFVLQRVENFQCALRCLRELKLDSFSRRQRRILFCHFHFLTSNKQHRTSNIQFLPAKVHWMLGVGCSMLVVFHFKPSAPRPNPSTPVRSRAYESIPPLRRRNVRRQSETARSHSSHFPALAPIRLNRTRVPQSVRAQCDGFFPCPRPCNHPVRYG